MSNFLSALQDLQGKKARFFVGGGDRGLIQGPIQKVDGDVVFIMKEGEIRGTMHAITINANEIRYFEQDILVETEPPAE